MAYNRTKIKIPSVSGDIEIIVSTARTERQNAFNKLDSNIADASRINSSGGTTSAAANQLVTGFIPCVKGNTITLETDKATDANSYTGMIACYDSSKTYLSRQYYRANANWTWASDFMSGVFNSKNVSDFPDNTTYIRICTTYQAAYATNDNIKIYIE